LSRRGIIKIKYISAYTQKLWDNILGQTTFEYKCFILNEGIIIKEYEVNEILQETFTDYYLLFEDYKLPLVSDENGIYYGFMEDWLLLIL